MLPGGPERQIGLSPTGPAGWESIPGLLVYKYGLSTPYFFAGEREFKSPIKHDFDTLTTKERPMGYSLTIYSRINSEVRL